MRFFLRGSIPVLLSVFIPEFAFAAVTTSTLVEVLGSFTGLINKAIPPVLGLTLLFFLWGLAKYILAAADEKKQVEGRTIMVEGIIALTVAVSVWGLVNLINNTLGLESIGSEFPPLIDPKDITPPKTS